MNRKKKKTKKKRKKTSSFDPLTYQLYAAPIHEEKTFPWGKTILIIFLIFIIFGIITDDGSYVDECQKGFFNFIPCHCYKPNDPDIPFNCL